MLEGRVTIVIARGLPLADRGDLRGEILEEPADLHERFERRLLLDEGFTALESVYRDALVSPGPPLNSDRAPISVSPSAAARAVDLCRDAREAMERNPNEGLLLEWLLLHLPSPGHGA